MEAELIGSGPEQASCEPLSIHPLFLRLQEKRPTGIGEDPELPPLLPQSLVTVSPPTFLSSPSLTVGPQAPAAPVERRKLNLAPRSQATGDAAPTSGSSSSIFGSAKPIDTTAREAETFAKRQEERKKAQEERAKALKEEDDKIKAEADARAKSITDARDAAIREAGGVPPAAPQAKKPQGQGQGPRQGPGGPGRQNSNGPHGHGQGQQNRPARGGRTNSNQAQKTEDGFEVARGSRRDNREEQAAAQAQAKKDAPVRKGFSFAAAAGLVEDTEGDDKDDESEDVSKRLAEVKV